MEDRKTRLLRLLGKAPEVWVKVVDRSSLALTHLWAP